MNDCGDFHEGRHVTIPRNIEGVFNGYYDRDDGPSGISRMARIDIPTSPGQKSLVCRANEIHTFWALERVPDPPKPKVRNAWTKILEDD